MEVPAAVCTVTTNACFWHSARISMAPPHVVGFRMCSTYFSTGASNSASGARPGINSPACSWMYWQASSLRFSGVMFTSLPMDLKRQLILACLLLWVWSNVLSINSRTQMNLHTPQKGWRCGYLRVCLWVLVQEIRSCMGFSSYRHDVPCQRRASDAPARPCAENHHIIDIGERFDSAATPGKNIYSQGAFSKKRRARDAPARPCAKTHHIVDIRDRFDSAYFGTATPGENIYSQGTHSKKPRGHRAPTPRGTEGADDLVADGWVVP
jgi:hypothetical protein